MKKQWQQGFSMIELMIALLLGIILLLGITQVMISSSSLGTTTNNLFVNQDKAKTVLDLLGGESKRAGYIGCGVGGKLDLPSATWDKKYPLVPLSGLGLRFTYGIDAAFDSSGGEKLPNVKNCINGDLNYRAVSYWNCTDKVTKNKGVCISSTNKSSADAGLVAEKTIVGVTLEQIVFTIPTEMTSDGNKFKEIKLDGASTTTIDENLAKDLLNAKSVTFYIKVETGVAGKAAMTDVEREYSASFMLRNL